MPARPIHRFSAEDRYFRGAKANGIADLKPGAAAIFGLAGHEDAARSIRDASWALEAASPSSPIDLGDSAVSPAETAMEIVKCKGRPFLLASEIESAISVLSNCPHDIVIAISAGLPFLPEAFGNSRLISIGLHDLVPASVVRAWRSSGAHFVPVTGTEAFDKRLSGVIGAIEKGTRAVLLLDVGVVDTGYAAATSSVNVGGLAAIDVVDAVETISRHLGIVGFASVGLNADLDPRGHTELMVAATVDSASDSAARS